MEDGKKPLETKKIAHDVMSLTMQGFADSESNACPLTSEDAKLANEIVARVIGKIRASVMKARGDGETRVQLHTYSVERPSSSAGDIFAHRAACERLMAALNANPELHAWVETYLAERIARYNRLMLDFSRLHARPK
jgi:hypothetical protein